jgi:nitrite reductase/ring-hydroxylating ferredoxin subunit
MAGEYVKVATTDQIKEGQTIVVKIGRDEMVIANVDGQFYAVSDYCPTAVGFSTLSGLKERIFRALLTAVYSVSKKVPL